MYIYTATDRRGIVTSHGIKDFMPEERVNLMSRDEIPNMF